MRGTHFFSKKIQDIQAISICFLHKQNSKCKRLIPLYMSCLPSVFIPPPHILCRGASETISMIARTAS